MSRLAQQWTERNFSLPRRIKSLESDFCNGYLFLCMLKQKGYLSDEDFETCLDRPDPATSEQNFRLVASVLEDLKITLTKKQIANVGFVSFSLCISKLLYFLE